MGCGLTLIALGFGYKIWADAGKEKANVKIFGRLVGIVIMALSALCIWQCTVNCPMGGGYGKMNCPLTGAGKMNRMMSAPVNPAG